MILRMILVSVARQVQIHGKLNRVGKGLFEGLSIADHTYAKPLFIPSHSLYRATLCTEPHCLFNSFSSGLRLGNEVSIAAEIQVVKIEDKQRMA